MYFIKLVLKTNMTRYHSNGHYFTTGS